LRKFKPINVKKNNLQKAELKSKGKVYRLFNREHRAGAVARYGSGSVYIIPDPLKRAGFWIRNTVVGRIRIRLHLLADKITFKLLFNQLKIV
jgi:hypothetical protein